MPDTTMARFIASFTTPVLLALCLGTPAALAGHQNATAAAPDSAIAVGPESPALREDSIRFASGDVELRGMLRLPPDPDDGPFPAVLLLPGGGTRHLTLEPDYWARRLAVAGVAAFVYHKRGTGDSGGDWATASFEDLIADAGAAIEALRARGDIGRIGVMGFSQGGRLAPIVAARFGLDAAVAISGPQLTPAETRLYALGNALRRGGAPPENVELALELWRAHMDRVRDGRDPAPLDARIADAATRMNPQVLPPISAAFAPSPIFNSLDFDGRPDLARLEAPLLAMYGADDEVVPTRGSVEALREAFAASGYRGLELVVIAGVGHGLSVDPHTRHPLYESTPVPWLKARLEDSGDRR